uniref:Uncharacterized protein n=1 Tax=Arundo donax TaxID=35708 RepID=A0A0A9CQJ8_ARUDO
MYLRPVQLPRADGNSPDILLLSKRSSSNLLSFPMVSGILPVSPFDPRSRTDRLLSLTRLEPSRIPRKPLFGKESCSNEVALNSSGGRAPVRLLWPDLNAFNMEQLPNSVEIMPLNSLKQRSSMANDGARLQTEDGIGPVKLLLLALRATRFFITSSAVDGNCPVKELLEIFSTWRGRPGFEDCHSFRDPDRWL